MIKKFLHFSGILLPLIVITSLLITGCSKKEEVQKQPPDVKFITAIQKDVPIKAEWVGQTIGSDDIELRSKVDGYLQGFYFTEGTFVNKGQLLYVIDAKELEQQVESARGRLAAARTQLAQAEYDVNRYTPLARDGAVSQRTLELALTTYDTRKSEVESAEAFLRLTQINLGYSRIYSPITGLIGISNYKVGDYIGKSGTYVMNTVSKIDPIHVLFSISEQEYLSLIKMYKKTELRKEEERSKLDMILVNGEIYEHPGVIIIAQRQVDVSTGTLQFKASFPNPDNILRPGQFAKIRTVIENLKDAILIPNICITELQGQLQVYVVGDDNKVQLRTIKAGPKFANFRVVDSGVKPGEKVITEGMQRVRPEMMVKSTDDSARLDSLLKSGGL
jgi:membrane fusion protein, multidrug efflux system